MKLFILKRNPDRPSEIEVHLEIWTSFRALVESVIWYALFVLMGIALHRAYFRVTGC
jgi:hypothetical protein